MISMCRRSSPHRVCTSTYAFESIKLTSAARWRGSTASIGQQWAQNGLCSRAAIAVLQPNEIVSLTFGMQMGARASYHLCSRMNHVISLCVRSSVTPSTLTDHNNNGEDACARARKKISIHNKARMPLWYFSAVDLHARPRSPM